jgi:hypothetical protein
MQRTDVSHSIDILYFSLKRYANKIIVGSKQVDEERNNQIKEYMKAKQRQYEIEKRRQIEQKIYEEKKKEELLLYNNEIKEKNKQKNLKRAISMHNFDSAAPAQGVNPLEKTRADSNRHFSSEKKRYMYRDENLDRDFESVNDEYRNILGNLMNQTKITNFHQKSLSSPGLGSKVPHLNQGNNQRDDLYLISPPNNSKGVIYQEDRRKKPSIHKSPDSSVQIYESLGVWVFNVF